MRFVPSRTEWPNLFRHKLAIAARVQDGSNEMMQITRSIHSVLKDVHGHFDRIINPAKKKALW